MSEFKRERKGEIALMYLKHKLLREGIKISKETPREIANTARQIGIDPNEAIAFAEILVRELVDQVFDHKKYEQPAAE